MDPLEVIFNQVSKEEKDGKRHIFFKDHVDIAFLYATGFVDAKKFNYKQWLDSFDPSKQPDGSYIVSKEQWMEKRKFYYDGPIHPPWDPMAVEEREYSEKEIHDLLVEKVLPCTIFDASYAQVYINNLKAQGRLANGKAKVDKPAKEYILQVINQYPSPMRVLEVSVYRLRDTRLGQTQAAQNQIQKSGFAAGMTAQEIHAQRLASLSKTPSAAKQTPPPASDKPAISIKDLKKKRRTPGKV